MTAALGAFGRFSEPSATLGFNELRVSALLSRQGPSPIAPGTTPKSPLAMHALLILGFNERLGGLSFFRSKYRQSEARFCFSIVRDNQAKGISTTGRLHGQVRRAQQRKRSFVELPIVEMRIITDSVFISCRITPVNLWTRRVDE
jgi:hypothetical protein